MATQNLKLRRGTTYDMSYTHPEDMTGGTVYFTVKSEQYDSDVTDTTAVIKKDVSTFTLSGTKASWQLTDNDMQQEPKTYYYDIVYRKANGTSLPPAFEGKFEISGKPTNRNI